MEKYAYTDQQLDYWGDMFIQNKILLDGVKFESFIQNPIIMLTEQKRRLLEKVRH